MREVGGPQDGADDDKQWRARTDALLRLMSIRDQQQYVKEEATHLQSLWATGKISEQEYLEEMRSVTSMLNHYDELLNAQSDIADMLPRKGIAGIGKRAIRMVVRPFIVR